MEGKVYEIGGVKYTQKPLVLGQLRQLLSVIQDVAFSKDMSTLQIINILGDKLPAALAIILIKDGTVSLKDRDTAALSDELMFSMTTDQVMEVVGDFFELMPVNLLLERLGNIVSTWTEKVMVIGSKISPLSSPVETLPSEIQ